jgi:Grx4 family monothiol glutaredoxin
MSVVVDVTTNAEIPQSGKAVLFYFAFWHEACAPLIAVLEALAGTAPTIFFGRVDADQASDLATSHNVSVVPSVLLLVNGAVVERMEGGSVDPSQLTVAVQRLQQHVAGDAATTTTTATASATLQVTQDPEKALTQRFDRLIKGDTVMVFMKGSPTAPRCGFSRQVVEILNENLVPFGSFDILTDDAVRQGLKVHSNWPTYPQLYVNGELMGGLDILKEMQEEGPLAEQWNLQPAAAPESLNDRLGKLITRHNCMLFMKGLPSAPQCGFSKRIVELLEEQGVAYDAFNILEDEEVRQGLKEYSNWPTFPQLYAKGELVGGLDICEEIAESGDLKDMLQ